MASVFYVTQERVEAKPLPQGSQITLPFLGSLLLPEAGSQGALPLGQKPSQSSLQQTAHVTL